MTRERRRRSGGRRRTAGALQQLPWRRVENTFRPTELLRAEQVEAIHEASLRILEELGVEMMNAEARSILEQAGALVDHDTGVVRVGRDIVEDRIARAPARFTLTPRNAEHEVEIGGRSVVFTTVGGPPSVHDCERGRRTGNYRDYCDLVRLAQSLNIVHMVGNQPTSPQDLPADTRHLDAYHANLTLTDRAYMITAVGGRRSPGARPARRSPPARPA